jgi:peptide/nickel transport system substrate-binding protein
MTVRDGMGRARSLRRLLVAVALVAAGCTSSTTAPPEAGPARPDAIVPGGAVIVAVDTEPASFNNRTLRGNTTVVRNVMRRVWPSVFTVTPTFETVLDTDFVTSAVSSGREPQTIVYEINPRAVWSDGTRITADDFIYNWEVGKPGARDSIKDEPIINVAPGEDTIASITGTNDGRTVTVVLKQPMAEWQSLFSKPLVPAHVAKRVGWNEGFNTAAVVSGGPFKLATYNPGRDLTLVRNEQYWGTKTNLESVTFNFVKDSSAAVTAMRNREAHVVAPRAQVDLLAQLANTDDITVQAGTSFEGEFLDFNLENAFLADRRVRQAFALSLDRNAIVGRSARQIDKAAGVMQHRILAAGHPGYVDTSGGRYDVRDVPQAKRLLESAGFVMGADGIYTLNGNPLVLHMIAAAGDALRSAQGELIQSQVKDAGIMLVPANLPDDNSANGLSARRTAGAFDVANLSQGLATSPTTTSASFATGGRVNISKYSNATVDRLYAEAASELDSPSRRVELLNQIDRQLWEDLPRLPLYQRPTIVAFQTGLLNVGINPVSGPFWNLDKWGRKA